MLDYKAQKKYNIENKKKGVLKSGNRSTKKSNI